MVVGFIILVLALGAMAVGGLDLWSAFRDDPHHGLKAWIGWTPLAAAGIATMMADAGPEAAFWGGIVGGPLAYPFMRVAHWMRWEMTPDPAVEDAKNRERMKYRATDFGRTPPPTSPPQMAPAAPPPTLPAPGRTRPLEVAAIAFAFAMSALAYVALFNGGAFDPPPTGRELVVATLEKRGFVSPRVYRETGTSAETCAGTAYYWTAAGAEGGACGREGDGYVTVWVERTWARPGAASPTAVIPVSPEAKDRDDKR